MRINSRVSLFETTLFLLFGFISNFADAAVPFHSIAKCGRSKFAQPNSQHLAKCIEKECTIDEKGTLTCPCYDNSGVLRNVSLPIYACPNDLAFPRCADHIKLGPSGGLSCRTISPASTYTSSCFDCKTNGSILKCLCFPDDGRVPKSTELDMKHCDSPVLILNCDGDLSCTPCPEPDRTIWVWAKRIAFYGAVPVITIVVIHKARMFFGR